MLSFSPNKLTLDFFSPFVFLYQALRGRLSSFPVPLFFATAMGKPEEQFAAFEVS